MLDAYIIEELKRQEEKRRKEEANRPKIHLPVPEYVPEEKKEDPSEEYKIEIPSDGEDEQEGSIRIPLRENNPYQVAPKYFK